MESFIQTLILIHAAFGGMALITGFVAMTTKKGSDAHRMTGRAFYFTMIISALTAIVVAFVPNHYNPFLLAIGVFSLFFVVTGNRARQFKFKNHNTSIDKTISIIMVVVGLLMIVVPLFIRGQLNIVLTVFGAVGVSFASRFLVLYQNPEKLQADWLKMHLGNMMGGYISALTAFIVVNQFFPPIISWFGPGILGGIYITYWLLKINKTRFSE